MKLVIVESPAKCQTIKNYLGKDYQVVASKGHILDLATTGEGGLGIDVKNNFKAHYIVNSKKKGIVAELKKLAKESSEVILATDPDREGEAIAYHLAKELRLDVKKTKRLEFHEITKESINTAIEAPRTIDLNLVSSQETRRILDRIIGFKLSKLLWKKIHSQSAGRVQSAALKLIYDKEKEILAFIPEEYWNINVLGSICDEEYPLTLKKVEGKTIKITDEQQASLIVSKITKEAVLTDITSKIKTAEPKLPYSTSALQQAAFSSLGFDVNKTQRIAQKLYEGFKIKDEHVGLITYLRTDSTRLSDSFQKSALDFIKNKYGENYLGKGLKAKKNKNSQDGHEAIRPTSVFRTPDSIKSYLEEDEYKLYKLIYQHTLASLMSSRKDEIITMSFDSNGVELALEGSKVVFDGFEAALSRGSKTKSKELPILNKGDVVKISSVNKEQKFTQPPSRYSEGHLVKKMEEVGIGRPSTYASTIAILIKRRYIEREKGILQITDQGKKTAGVLKNHFADLVDYKYTSKMETELDQIQEGKIDSIEILKKFYKPFIDLVEKAYINIYVDGMIKTGELCPDCGSPLVYRNGRKGEFIGCSNFPACHYIKVDLVHTGEKCPECGHPLVKRPNKKGKYFVGCSNYPYCKYIKGKEEKLQKEPLERVKICPECGRYLVKRKTRKGDKYFLGCEGFPKCKHIENIEEK